MRMHIVLDDELVAELDARVGPRGRTRFVAAAIRAQLDADAGWRALSAVAGSIPDSGHEWDGDPAEWVRQQRFADTGRVG